MEVQLGLILETPGEPLLPFPARPREWVEVRRFRSRGRRYTIRVPVRSVGFDLPF